MSMGTMVFSFIIYPLSFKVRGWDIPIIAASNILSMASSYSKFGIIVSSLYSSFEPLLEVFDFFLVWHIYFFIFVFVLIHPVVSTITTYVDPFFFVLYCWFSSSLKGGGIYLLDLSMGYFFELLFDYLFDFSRAIKDGLLNLFFCSINFVACLTSSVVTLP